MTNPLFDLTGKTALVTGSSQGIGLALAHGLADAGATVILNGRNEDKLAAAAAAFSSAVHIRAFDVTDSAAVANAIGEIENAIGPIDILVNNAGIQIRGRIDEYADEDWERLTATNIDSLFYVSKAVARHHDCPRRRQDHQYLLRPLQALAARPLWPMEQPRVPSRNSPAACAPTGRRLA